MTRLPRMFLSSWVDNKRPQQRPQFNYGHGLRRDLRNAGLHINNWASLASDRSIWHSITQQKNVFCNINGGGYIWVDPEQLAQAAAENILPSPSSYAGVLLGLSPLPDAPAPVVPGPAYPSESTESSVEPNPKTPPPLPLTLENALPPSPCPSQSVAPNHAPRRHSSRLANQAELAGGRKVYSHTTAPRIPLR